MPSDLIIKVKCPVYLIRFQESFFGIPLGEPICYSKRHHFSEVLDHFLTKPPKDYYELPNYGEETLQIKLPYFEDKDVRSYFYLSNTKQKTFVWHIWAFYRVTARTELTKLILLKCQKQDCVSIFMEKYNLPENSRGMVEKDYQRYLKLTSKNTLKKLRKISSV